MKDNPDKIFVSFDLLVEPYFEFCVCLGVVKNVNISFDLFLMPQKLLGLGGVD